MNKIIIFIVEGITDNISLSNAIDEILENYNIKFYLCDGDFTSDNKITPSNILKEIGTFLNGEIGREYLKKKDIFKVIHIVDTDGTFVNETFMKNGDVADFFYDENYIMARDTQLIKDRNARKVQNLEKLINTTKILKSIPYKIFYFSSNLEHVFHNKLNLSRKEKNELAEKLEKKYIGNSEEFIQFLNKENIKIKGEYLQTWEYLKKGNNSLKKGTNFSLFFEELEDNMKD